MYILNFNIPIFGTYQQLENAQKDIKIINNNWSNTLTKSVTSVLNQSLIDFYNQYFYSQIQSLHPPKHLIQKDLGYYIIHKKGSQICHSNNRSYVLKLIKKRGQIQKHFVIFVRYNWDRYMDKRLSMLIGWFAILWRAKNYNDANASVCKIFHSLIEYRA